MRLFLLLALFSFSLPVLAQSIYVYPATVTAPRGSYQTVTAVVTGTANKTVTWTTTGGTLVGVNPCVVNEPCTIALYTTTPGSYTVTATSNATGTVFANSAITVTASPSVATGHPRLLITPAMLPGLRAKAVAGNAVYSAIRNKAISLYNYDNTSAGFSWSCNGGTGLPTTDQTTGWQENYAYYFAFMSLVDPSDPTYHWGCYGRDTWTYFMTKVLNGGITNPANEWSDSAASMAVTSDWLMAGNFLNSADQIQARAFLAHMAKTVLLYGSTQNPSGAYNSSAMYDNGSSWDLGGMRADGGNNYNLSRMLYLAAAGLTFDDNTTDDPALANTCSATRYKVCPDFSAGSLHGYWKYLDGAVLYDYWAHIEDPNVSWQAYQAAYGNLPTQPVCKSTDLLMHPCFGDGRGGESSEGSWYQYSMYRTRYMLNILHTTGYDDPILYGPQVSAGTSSWWDMKYVSDLEFLTSYNATNGGGISGYAYLSTGDANSYTRNVADGVAQSAMLVADSYTGRTDRKNALMWYILNLANAGPLGTNGPCASHCGFLNNIGNDIGGPVDFDLFEALPAGDPTVGMPADPRPSLPLDLYNGSINQHIMTRSSWDPSGVLFSYYAPNATINHEQQWAGRFDILSKGEYITKGREEFNDYNELMATISQNNGMAIVNSAGTSCPLASGQGFCFAFNYGGQTWLGLQAGPIALQHQESPSYVAAIIDTTNVYNGAASQHFGDYNDVVAASRSLVYLRGTNQVVFYDRAATGHAASTRAVYQNTTGAPSIAGSVASWLTRSGTQRVYFTSLLPAGATMANNALIASAYWQQATDWEPYSTLAVTPSGTPLNTQFLSVLEFGPTAQAQSATTLVQSTAGQNFDGAKVGSSLVMFMRKWPTPLVGVTYPASGATTQYVSDLSPNTPYSIMGEGAPSSAFTDAAGVLTFAAAGTGDITLAVHASQRSTKGSMTGL